MSRPPLRLLAAVFATVAVSAVPAAIATPPPPDSFVAVGGGASAAADSWSTSSNPAVRSLYLRYRKEFHRWYSSPVHAYSLATPDFSIADLAEQARLAEARAPGSHATVEVGVQDLCAGVPLEQFRAQLDRGLRVLSKPHPDSGHYNGGILLVSIEDLTQKWRALRADPAAAQALKAGRHLACGLGYDVAPARLAQIRARTIALNQILERVCFQNVRCLYDKGTRFHMPLKASYFSPPDYRRLSPAGQRAVAAAEWKPESLLLQHIG